MMFLGGSSRKAGVGVGWTCVLACLWVLAWATPAAAQLFSDRPPPVPPASVPDAPSAPAISLAPPSGPASGPPLPAALTQPPVTAITPPSPPAAAPAPSHAVLALTARYGKDLPVINGGLIWRIFSDKPD